uniref:8.9 kDa family member n=1 Tax=Rhipicephalus zambeziensis TaxID=60191 RepID=A0A224Y734_9ACAR
MPTFTVLVGALIVSTMVYCPVLESANIYLRRGHCTHKKGTIKNGEKRNLKNPCAEATCNGGNLSLRMCERDATTDDRNCEIYVNKTARYPHCCPRLFCSLQK